MAMSDEVYDDTALERQLAEFFGVRAEIRQVIARHISVSRSAWATVLMTNKKQLFVYIDGQKKMTLGDVQKIVTRMGLKPEMFMPPKHHPDFFDAIGREKFKETFPGRSHISDADIRFYRTLAPYKPALVLIGEVRDGNIYQYDADSTGEWRPSVKFAYRRIKTS